MKYYRINTLGDAHNQSLCTIDRAPDGLGVKYFFMMEGRKIGSAYPADAKVRMSDKYPGDKLSSFLGNTESYLIGSAAIKELFEAHMTAEVEYLPFTLVNPKGKVHSQDYFIINPIGVFDCLNLKACDIKYLPGKNKIVKVRKFVLDPNKLTGAPALFRVKEDPTEYVISEDLKHRLDEAGSTNLVVQELELMR